MDRQRRMEKENKSLATEKCENIDTLYITVIIINDAARKLVNRYA